jgi:hypothetical protein
MGAQVSVKCLRIDENGSDAELRQKAEATRIKRKSSFCVASGRNLGLFEIPSLTRNLLDSLMICETHIPCAIMIIASVLSGLPDAD